MDMRPHLLTFSPHPLFFLLLHYPHASSSSTHSFSFPYTFMTQPQFLLHLSTHTQAKATFPSFSSLFHSHTILLDPHSQKPNTKKLLFSPPPSFATLCHHFTIFAVPIIITTSITHVRLSSLLIPEQHTKKDPRSSPPPSPEQHTKTETHSPVTKHPSSSPPKNHILPSLWSSFSHGKKRGQHTLSLSYHLIRASSLSTDIFLNSGRLGNFGWFLVSSLFVKKSKPIWLMFLNFLSN